MSENYVLEFIITNFKSYFTEPVNFNIIKPLTIIAGPNGEGKSNLLESILVGVANFMKHSKKFRSTSLFTKPIEISSRPPKELSLYDLVFHDIIRKGRGEKSYTERLDPVNIVSHRKIKSSVQFKIIRCLERSSRRLVEMTTNITRTYKQIQDTGYFNQIGDLEFLYLNPDSYLNDLFIKLVGQEFSEQTRDISGTSRKADFQRNILDIFSDEDDRLIRDIDNGKFEEKYFEDVSLFLTSNLATGAKKECMLYILRLIVEKLKNKKDWVMLFLVDEIESGLHMSRQKIMIEALIKAFHENEELRKHVKIVMTTHSPIIYSELMKHPDYVDVYFVFRNPQESSKIFKYDDIVGDEYKEKRILAELGLNIYELPETILFVEGKTDKEFWSEILENIGIHPLRGASIPNILLELIKTYPLARSKKYYVVVDKNAYDNIEETVQKLREENINIYCDHINYNSLEEFIFGVNIDTEEPIYIWNKIEKRLQEFRDSADESEKEILDINMEKVRGNLEKREQDGLIAFFDSLKNKDEFYKLIGKNWSTFLEKKAMEIVENMRAGLI